MGSTQIAFVILTWNSERYIENCLNSILSTSLDAQVYVIDNGSKDSTVPLLKKYESQSSKIHLILQKVNLGTTISRNIALKSVGASCDFICILDSDTVINQASFVKMIQVLRQDETIGVVGPTMRSRDGRIQLSGRNLPSLGIKLGKVFPAAKIREKASSAEIPRCGIINGIQDVDYLLSACWLMPTNSIKQVGFFDEKIFYAPEDVDWCVRCHRAGLRVVRCHDASLIHEYQRISHKKLFSRTNVEHIKGLIYYFRKYRYLISSKKVLSLGE